jgi:hypothetical protein
MGVCDRESLINLSLHYIDDEFKRYMDRQRELKAKEARKKSKLDEAKSQTKKQKESHTKEKLKSFLKCYGFEGKSLGPMKLETMDRHVKEMEAKIAKGELVQQHSDEPLKLKALDALSMKSKASILKEKEEPIPKE